VDVQRQQRADEIAGHHKVVRLIDGDSVRLKRRREARPAKPNVIKVRIVFDHTPGWDPCGPPMNVARKPPVLRGANSSVIDASAGFVGPDELRFARIRDVEEEHLIVPTQNAQQTASASVRPSLETPT